MQISLQRCPVCAQESLASGWPMCMTSMPRQEDGEGRGNQDRLTQFHTSASPQRTHPCKRCACTTDVCAEAGQEWRGRREGVPADRKRGTHAYHRGAGWGGWCGLERCIRSGCRGSPLGSERELHGHLRSSSSGVLLVADNLPRHPPAPRLLVSHPPLPPPPPSLSSRACP